MNIKDLLKHLFLIALFLGIILAAVLVWLRFYTNHGQELELSNYIGAHIDDAMKDAENQSFRMIVSDSTHIVGKPGGEIISQNPKAGSKVKENRKIYVTISKYNADLISIGSLPTLYGTEYNSKCKDLKYLEIECKIKGYEYDVGEKDHILKVFYKGELIVSSSEKRKNHIKIEKGAVLEFVLSKKSGAEISVPDFKCKTLAEARFLIENSGLNLTQITEQGTIDYPESAYILSQNPFPGEILESGSTINVKIQQEKPEDCN